MNDSGTQNGRWIGGEIKDGGFNSDLRWPAVHNEPDLQSSSNVLGCSGRELSRQVCAWHGKGKAASTNNRLHEGMTWPAHAHRFSARCNDVRNPAGTRKHQGEGTRPEGGREF